MRQKKGNIKLNIVLLIILLILYFLVNNSNKIFKNNKKTEVKVESSYIPPKGIKELNIATKKLNKRVDESKEYIDDFFFKDPTVDNLKGILDASPGDTKIHINDNFGLILKKEDNPIEIRYRDNIYELQHSGNIINNSTNEDFIKNNDVVITKLSKGRNEAEEIIYLKTYLQAMGKEGFNNLLNKEIDERTKKIEKILKNTY